MPLHLDPQLPGRRQIPSKDVQGTDEPVAGAKHSSDYLIEIDRRIEPRDVLRPDLDRLGQPLLVLNSSGGPEHLELAGGGSKPEIPRRMVASVPACFFPEAAQLLP